MPKGQMEIKDVFATLVFTSTVLALIILVGSLVVTKASFADTISEALSVEFANLVRSGLAEDGVAISYEKLQSSGSLEEFGFTGKRALITNLVTQEQFPFRGDSGEYKHKIFVALESEYFPVTEGSSVVLEKGKIYLINLYMTSMESLAVDIYREPVCSVSERYSHDFKALKCGTMSNLMTRKEVVGINAGSLKGYVESAKEGNDVIEKVKALEDVQLSDFLKDLGILGFFKGFEIGSPADCIREKGRLCCRVMGASAFPASLEVEIDNEDDFMGV